MLMPPSSLSGLPYLSWAEILLELLLLPIIISEVWVGQPSGSLPLLQVVDFMGHSLGTRRHSRLGALALSVEYHVRFDKACDITRTSGYDLKVTTPATFQF